MYPFLTQPPQQHRPPRRRSNSSSATHPYANISAWASTVQPGSPAPCSPPHRRPSSSSRRRTPRSGSFAAQRTPSSATGEYPADLTAVGYTSLFVYFDRTPTTPSPFQTRIGNGVDVVTPLTSHVFGSIPIPVVPPLPPQSTTAKPAKRTGFQRFRSILRTKKSKHPVQPVLVSSPVKSPKFAKVESAAIAQRKRAKYAGKKASAQPPPSLANELALMQFIEGGTMDDNVKRLMEARAKAVGGGGVERGLGVEGVYRDEKGGIWYDADEEMEYVHLLGPEEDEGEWEDQKKNIADKSEEDLVITVGPVVKAASPNMNAYCPLDLSNKDKGIRRSPTSTRTNSGSPVSPRILTHSKLALLSLPSRPRRNLRRPSSSNAYAHLSNAPTYLIDIDAFAPRSPNPKSPRPKGSSVTFAVGTTPSNLSKKHRPRPAPLQLSSSQSAHARANAKVALVTLNGKSLKGSSPSKVPLDISPSMSGGHKVTGLSPKSLDRARREFVEDSFQPTVKVGGLRSPRLGVVKGLFVKSTPKT